MEIFLDCEKFLSGTLLCVEKNLSTWMWTARRQSKATGRVPHKGKIILAHSAAPMLAMILRKFTKSEKPVFTNQWTVLAIAPRLLVTSSEQRLADHAEVKATGRDTSLDVIPETSSGQDITPDDPCACSYRVIAVAFIIYVVWRRQRCHFAPDVPEPGLGGDDNAVAFTCKQSKLSPAVVAAENVPEKGAPA